MNPTILAGFRPLLNGFYSPMRTAERRVARDESLQPGVPSMLDTGHSPSGSPVGSEPASKQHSRRALTPACLALALGLITLTGAWDKTVAAEASPSPQVSGIVVDEQGRPVAGATVDCYHYQARPGYTTEGKPELERRTVTDSKGAFAVPSSRGTTLVVVKKAGLATGWKTWNSLLGVSPEPLVLTAPTGLAGVVVDANHRPVADAEVWVLGASFADEHARAAHENDLFGKPARECFSARTAADGRFRIENFPADGHAALGVRMTGKSPHQIGSGYAGGRGYQSGEEHIELMVGPPGAIEGKVVATETGQPLRGVRVKFQPPAGELHVYESIESDETSADGAFRIPQAEPGLYFANAIGATFDQPAPDWMAVLRENGSVRVVAGETTRNVVVHASKGAWVEVTVAAGDTLKPLADVEVSSSRFSGGSSAYTGADGVALLRVPPGQWWISAAKKDWAPQGSVATIETDRTNQVRFELPRATTITGTIRNRVGASAAGVLVSFHPGQYPGASPYVEGRTDSNGRYELTITRELREAFVWIGPIIRTNFMMARCPERNLAAIQEFDTLPTDLDLTLEPGITLSGSVKDAEGAPLTSAMLDLSILVDRSAPQLDPRPAHVDARGSFAFPALPQGREYFVHAFTARSYGRAGGDLKAKDAKPGRYEFPAFVLKRAERKLAGRVLGPGEKPVAGAEVSFSGQGQREPPTTKTDSDGRFVFDAVCEGEVYLHARSYGPPETRPGVPTVMATSGYGAKTQAGDTNIVIQLRDPSAGAVTGPQSTTTGTIFDPSGAPAPLVMVRVWRSAGLSRQPTATPEEDI